MANDRKLVLRSTGLFLATALVFGTIAAKADGSDQPLDPKLDATITAYLEQRGALGDTLRQFHMCVVRAALNGRLAEQGVLGVYSPMGDCSRTGVSLVAQCMKIQHNGSACGAVIATTSAHAVQHAQEFRGLMSPE